MTYQLIRVRRPIPMIRLPLLRLSAYVLHDWRDPYRVEPHPLDIVELANHGLIRPAAVLGGRYVASGSDRVRAGKAVRDDLVDPPLAVSVIVQGEQSRKQRQKGKENGEHVADGVLCE